MSAWHLMTSLSFVDEQKSSLRKQALKRRAQLALDYRVANQASKTGLVRFADSLIHRSAPKIVAGYWPVRAEINPLPLLLALENKGIKLCLPITGPLASHYLLIIGNLEQLDIGRFGIKQPFQDAEQLIPDLICLPLLAFDSKCQRLGYGGGYYDRTLAGLRIQGHKIAAVGLAYAGQQIDSLVTGPYDEQMETVLTPDGWLNRSD